MTGVASFEDVVEAFVDENPSADIDGSEYAKYVDVVPSVALAHSRVQFPHGLGLGWRVQSVKELSSMGHTQCCRGLRVFVGKQEGAAQDDSEEPDSVVCRESVRVGEPLPCDTDDIIRTSTIARSSKTAVYYVGGPDE